MCPIKNRKLFTLFPIVDTNVDTLKNQKTLNYLQSIE